MKKRILSIVLTLCMVLMLVPTTAFAEGITPATPQTDTDGVYQIGTAEELYGFAQLVNNGNTSASAVLTADITVNSNLLNSLNEDGTVKDGATVTSWTPIGNTSNPYTGSFDGQGHTVSGLYFNDSNTSFVGLFGNLGSSGEIKNVGVIDSYFNGYLSVGGVCGKNTGIITSCYNTGEVSGKESVGGVCGESFGTITGCYNTGEVSGKDSVGGVCGWNVGGTITGCYNTGTVSGSNNNVGGVCAYNTDYDAIGGTITGCYNTGEVSGNESVGGVCGYEDNRCTIIGSYNTGTVSGTGNYVGGVCGFNFVGCIITGCYTNNGGVYGENNGTVTDCDVMSDDEFADATVCGLLNTALKNENSDVRFKQGANLPELFVSVGGVYQISSAEELYGFAELVNSGGTDQNTKAVLTADITVNKGVLKANGTLADDTSGFTSWTPIGNSSNSYTGKFDGQGHTISGLYFNDAAKSYVGLFGILGENGEIKNVGVIDSYFNGYRGVGGVCGTSDGGTISGCYNTGTVSGNYENVGGVCGKSDGGTISGCYNTGTVSSNNDHVGGVCGSTYGGDTITGCYNTGTVSGDYRIGGVCGYNGYGGEATITGCYNTGTVSGNRIIGGVCGKNDYYSSITGCYNTGTVSGDYRIGGVCGLNDNNGSIIGCYNIGTVSSNNDNVGGVCGWNWGESSITGCFTNKDVVCGENKSTETDCAVKSDKEFADSTVCKLLDTALQNASSDVRFCQRIGKDASPLLTYQFESIDDHTDKNPKDHICDICGEMLSDHIGIDENPKDHICDICRETLSTHTGGEATCTAKAECEYCGEEYGELDSSKHTGGTEIRGAKDATCTEEGYTGDTFCKGCGAKLSTGTAINMLDHNLEKISAKDATVTETGNTEYWQCKDCGKYFADENGTDEIALDDTVISKLPPEIIEGEGQSITEGELKELIFRSNAAFSDFIRVELDGKTLDEKNYTVKEGSTVVTLKADYVATLSAGEHTIGIVSASGTATTTFTVNVKAVVDNDTKSPQTGDNSHMALWIALLAASVFGLAGTAVYSKRKRVR